MDQLDEALARDRHVELREGLTRHRLGGAVPAAHRRHRLSRRSALDLT